MTIHEDIVTAINRMVDEHPGAVSPLVVALRLKKLYNARKLEAHIEYASLEHFKQMARRQLAGRFNPAALAEEGGVFITEQGDLFGVRMQARYPYPHKRGQDPTYQRVELLSYADLKWNVKQLRKASEGLRLHAIELEAYAEAMRDRDPPADAA
jgi:hypothetical protein